MIRGISRQMIELKETASPYYSAALLEVRPEYASAERAVLEREASRLLRSLDAPAGWKTELQGMRKLLPALLSGLIGVGAASGVFWFLLRKVTKLS